MSIYKAKSLQDLLSIDLLKSMLSNINNIEIERISTIGLSGSKMYKIVLISEEETKNLYLKVNNLDEDWLAKASNDKGRELTIFKEGIYEKIKEFIDGIYIGYYETNDSYAILMNDMSEFIISDYTDHNYFKYLDNLAKFHSKFSEHDVLSYKTLLNVEEYYNFLSMSKIGLVEEFKEDGVYGWSKLKEILGEELFNKYNDLKAIDEEFEHYPKTFLHGDYRPDNTLYISDKDIKIIDWANSGCGPCTLDLFWYLMTSVGKEVDKIELIDYYKEALEKRIGYKLTDRTWDTLLKVGMLCACRMFLAALIPRLDMNDDKDLLELDWWIYSLKEVLNSH